MTRSSDVQSRLADFRARTEKYLQRGYDCFAAPRYAVEAASPLTGPALDVGTGKGLMAMALAQAGLDVVSVDPDFHGQKLAILLAKEECLADRIHFLCGDAAFLPFPDGHFGCAALMDVLHHLADARGVLHEVTRVVRPQGIVIVADFSKQGFEMLHQMHREEGREHPLSGVTLDLAQDILSEEGFRLNKCVSGYLHEIAVLVKDAGRHVRNENIIGS